MDQLQQLRREHKILVQQMKVSLFNYLCCSRSFIKLAIANKFFILLELIQIFNLLGSLLSHRIN